MILPERCSRKCSLPVSSRCALSCQGKSAISIRKNDKTRKNHNVVFLPSFEAVEKFQNALEKIGNIRSDGRPILGLDARDLLEIVLDTDPQALIDSGAYLDPLVFAIWVKIRI